MPNTKSKPIFKGLTIALSCPLEGQWTDTNITRWVTQRSGSFIQEMNDQVTHLVIPQGPTKEQKEKPRVKQAMKRGVKTCKVVTLDWLEDSLLINKKLPERPYLLATLLKTERAREVEQAKKARATELEGRFVNTNLYHLYHDITYFRYEITLTRDNPTYGCAGQRYLLCLFESNAKPHLYWFAAKLYKKKGDNQPNYHRPSDSPQTFWVEYGKMKEFFRKKTGVEWDQRLMRTGAGDPSLFRYTLPVLGRPVGWVPAGCERQESPPVEDVGRAGSLAAEKATTGTVAGGQASGPAQVINEVIVVDDMPYPEGQINSGNGSPGGQHTDGVDLKMTIEVGDLVKTEGLEGCVSLATPTEPSPAMAIDINVPEEAGNTDQTQAADSSPAMEIETLTTTQPQADHGANGTIMAGDELMDVTTDAHQVMSTKARDHVSSMQLDKSVTTVKETRVARQPSADDEDKENDRPGKTSELGDRMVDGPTEADEVEYIMTD